MRISMYRDLRGRGYNSLTIDKYVLEDVNEDLARYYVLASDFNTVPQIESVESLEEILRAYDRNEYTNDYNITYASLIKKGKLNYCQSFYDTVFDIITDYLCEEPFALIDSDVLDSEIKLEE